MFSSDIRNGGGYLSMGQTDGVGLNTRRCLCIRGSVLSLQNVGSTLGGEVAHSLGVVRYMRKRADGT